ncbi:hypothetical protein E2C01_074335 [Portunus trituberculatus]|uniref:Uncharacterized protein n=1 Tax=Portunus trituberculatus TaxID=210409 RepID=A0A5B7IDA0_PORTR|nr:hypothetical protein [Portunus trituberculatus]
MRSAAVLNGASIILSDGAGDPLLVTSETRCSKGERRGITTDTLIQEDQMKRKVLVPSLCLHWAVRDQNSRAH